MNGKRASPGDEEGEEDKEPATKKAKII